MRSYLRRALWGAGLLVLPSIATAQLPSQALRLAVQHDPAVPYSLALQAAEREAGAQERAQLGLQIIGSAQSSYAYTDSQLVFGNARDTYASYGASIEARQPLYRADKSARLARATASEALADAGQAARAQQFLLRVATRYLSVLRAEDALQQAQQQAKAVAGELSRVRLRFEAGELPGMDVKEASARLDLAEATVLSAQQALQTAADQLQESTGQAPTALPRLPLERDIPALAGDLASWQAAASKSNPELVRLAQALASAEADVLSRKADSQLQLDAIGSVSRSDSRDYQLGAVQNDARVGLELRIPLYSAGLIQSRQREAVSRRDTQARLLALQAAQVDNLTRSQVRAVTIAAAQAKAFSKALQSSEAALAATRAGQEAGLRTIQDVLDAQTRVATAKQAAASARLDQLQAQFALKASAGALGEADFVALDALLAAKTTE